MTIEHIAPENPQNSGTVTDVGRIGNLLLLPQNQNSNLANLPFDKKLAAYKQAGVYMDSALSSATKWTNKEIQRRTDVLAKLAYKEIFKV